MDLSTGTQLANLLSPVHIIIPNDMIIYLCPNNKMVSVFLSTAKCQRWCRTYSYAIK